MQYLSFVSLVLMPHIRIFGHFLPIIPINSFPVAHQALVDLLTNVQLHIENLQEQFFHQPLFIECEYLGHKTVCDLAEGNSFQPLTLLSEAIHLILDQVESGQGVSDTEYLVVTTHIFV